jgi:hypothetical protein
MRRGSTRRTAIWPAAALHKLDGALDTANSAGTNGVGPDVARAYDAATDQVGQVAYRLVNVFSNLGSLLRQNGINHDQTEAASTLNQRDQYGAPVTPPGQTPGTYLDAGTDLGSIAGGDDPEPAHWDLVGDRITDGWPNGHPDRLLTAATAWEQYGHDLVAVNDLPSEQEYRLLTDVQAAEISTVIDRLNQAQRTRIPDEIDTDNRVIREVKNVKTLSATQQLRDMAQYAQENGFKLVIVVDKGRTAGTEGVEDRLEEKYPGLDVVIDDSMNLS